MAPSFLNFKDLRRRSKASFRTDRSTDTSSDASHGATPTTGSLTPPSIGQQSDPALNLQLKDQPSPPLSSHTRPPLQSQTNGATNRYSVSGMAGLGSPVQNGRGLSLPVSPYSPQITNVPESSWVSVCMAINQITHLSVRIARITYKPLGLSKGPLGSRHNWGPLSAIGRWYSHR